MGQARTPGLDRPMDSTALGWRSHFLRSINLDINLERELCNGQRSGTGCCEIWQENGLVELTYWVIGSLWRGFLGRAWLHSSPPPGLPCGGWGGDWLSPPGLCKDLLLEALLSSFKPQSFLELQGLPCRTILQETAVICFADIRNTPRRELMGGNTRSLSVQRVRCGIYFILTVFNKAPGDWFYVVRSFSLKKKSSF